MAADNIVELAAVLPNGTHILIAPQSDPDLFWAFRGGGGSTFGVVLSITVKVHPKIHMTVSQWSFSSSGSISNATFWEATRIYLEHVPALMDSGSQAFTAIKPTDGILKFTMTSFVAPNLTVAEYDDLMRPFFTRLVKLGITVEQNTTFHESYLGAWQRAFPKARAPYDPTRSVSATGSRLIPRKNIEDPDLFNRTFAALQSISALGYPFIFYAQKNTAPKGVDNAINPAYRTSAIFLITQGTYPQNSDPERINSVHNVVTDGLVSILKKVAPGSGTYMNEADVREKKWQRSFFGANYPRLLTLKNKLDPERVFYAKTAVGSEDWYIKDDKGLPEVQTGRLCRKIQ